jgi:hypothetical protein
MNRLTKFPALLVLFLIFLALIICYTWMFGLITFLASILVFGKIERDRNIHEISFYARGDLPSSIKKWLRYYGIAEVLGRSTVLGILPILLFSGTDNYRIRALALIFTVCVILGYRLLNFIQTRTHIDATRWAYVRLSVALGLLFSVISSNVPGLKLGKLALKTVKVMFTHPSFNEAAELLYGMTYKLNAFVTKILSMIFGDIIAHILGLIISVNIVYGFVAALYSLILFRFISRYAVLESPPIEPKD